MSVVEQEIGRSFAVIEDAGVVAVVRARSADDAVEVSEALIDAGVRAIEVTFTTPGAAEAIATLVANVTDRVAIGAGTVVDAGQATAAVDAGATFVVSPGYDPGLVDCVAEAGCLALPGVITPTEIMAASRRGHRALKLFPGSIGGPDYLRTLVGPFPDVRFMPTGGVTVDSIPNWLGAGAFAIGIGGSLAPPWITGPSHRAGVVAAAGEVVGAVASWRAGRTPAEVTR